MSKKSEELRRRLEEEDRRIFAEMRASRLASVPDRLRKCGIPELYIGVEPDFKAAKMVRRGEGDDRVTGLYIVGDVGRGKTTLACAIAKAKAIEAAERCEAISLLFTSMPDLFTRIRATYSGNGEREDAIIDEYSSCETLILDDMGKGSCNDWSLTIVYQILDRRVGSRLPTIVTTQYDIDSLGARLSAKSDGGDGKAIVSRLAGSCAMVPLTGPDRRMQRR